MVAGKMEFESMIQKLGKHFLEKKGLAVYETIAPAMKFTAKELEKSVPAMGDLPGANHVRYLRAYLEGIREFYENAERYARQIEKMKSLDTQVATKLVNAIPNNNMIGWNDYLAMNNGGNPANPLDLPARLTRDQLLVQFSMYKLVDTLLLCVVDEIIIDEDEDEKYAKNMQKSMRAVGADAMFISTLNELSDMLTSTVDRLTLDGYNVNNIRGQIRAARKECPTGTMARYADVNGKPLAEWSRLADPRRTQCVPAYGEFGASVIASPADQSGRRLVNAPSKLPFNASAMLLDRPTPMRAMLLGQMKSGVQGMRKKHRRSPLQVCAGVKQGMTIPAAEKVRCQAVLDARKKANAARRKVVKKMSDTQLNVHNKRLAAYRGVGSTRHVKGQDGKTRVYVVKNVKGAKKWVRKAASVKIRAADQLTGYVHKTKAGYEKKVVKNADGKKVWKIVKRPAGAKPKKAPAKKKVSKKIVPIAKTKTLTPAKKASKKKSTKKNTYERDVSAAKRRIAELRGM
jgi:hypothetical protein